MPGPPKKTYNQRKRDARGIIKLNLVRRDIYCIKRIKKEEKNVKERRKNLCKGISMEKLSSIKRTFGSLCPVVGCHCLYISV